MKTPQLKVLMAAYYHQDWVELGLWETLDEYIDDSSGGERAALAHEIDAVIADTPDQDLQTVLSGLGSYVLLDDDHPGGYRGWLQEIARRVNATL